MQIVPKSFIRPLGLGICLCVFGGGCPPAVGQDAVPFARHVINAESEFSAAAAIDVNGDGRLDIVCGAWWYEAPAWTRHRLREVEQIRGRFDDYSNLPLDVDGDGDLDLISVNYRSESLFWCRNPGPTPGDTLWEKVPIDRPGRSETGRLVDINGDGRLDLLPNGTNYTGWYELTSRPGEPVEWRRHDLPPEVAGHGVGAGDINGDGRVDIVTPRGWAEAPEDLDQGRWRWHPDFELARDCGLPILCHDVDGDGDTDLIWARGHNVGLYWTEQIGAEESAVALPDSLSDSPVAERLSRPGWVTHAIDTSWSSGHTLMLADIDGDGVLDLVTGKRYQGHEGRDPGENDPMSVHWYRYQPESRTWRAHRVSAGGTCGIDLDSKCVDLDGDGDIDILAPTRSGLHWLENLRIGDASRATSPDDADMEFALAYDDHDRFDYVLTAQGRRELATPLDHGIRRQQILRQMEEVMGELPAPERRVPLDVEVTRIEETDKYWRVRLSYAPEAGDRVPAYLLVPKGNPGPRAAMLCLHPTNFELGKGQICGLGGRPTRFYAHELAEAGYVCLAPDYPSFADYPYDFATQGAAYASGTMKAIWNNIRAVDLLESLPCVQRDRIGAIGHSLGGHNALYTAAFDQRLRCAVSSCGFNAFEDYYGGDLKGWSSPRYMPRIADRYATDPRRMPFDFHEVLAAIAPRPIFVNAPLRDSNFAVVGVRKCEASLRPLLKTLAADDAATRFVYPDAEHDFPDAIRTEAYDWLDSLLRPGR